MKYYVIYFIIVFGILGCGSRKVETDISKQSNKVDQKEESKSDTNIQKSISETSTEQNKADISNVETVTTTKYDNGKITETTVTQRTYTDKSINNKQSNKQATLLITEIVTVNKLLKQTITIKEKHKKSSTNNLALYAGISLLIFGIAFLVYRKTKIA